MSSDCVGGIFPPTESYLTFSSCIMAIPSQQPTRSNTRLNKLRQIRQINASMPRNRNILRNRHPQLRALERKHHRSKPRRNRRPIHRYLDTTRHQIRQQHQSNLRHHERAPRSRYRYLGKHCSINRHGHQERWSKFTNDINARNKFC